MSQEELYQRILSSLHEAALDDFRWPETSALIDEACAVKGSFLGAMDGGPPERAKALFGWICSEGQRQTELEHLYFDVYYPLDERIPRALQLPDSQPAHISSLYSPAEMTTSRVYNEALPLFNAQNSVYVHLHGPGGSHIGWMFEEPVKGDRWSSAQVETIKGLIPHIRQFIRMRQALVDADALGSSFAKLLDNTRIGVIQLDRSGRIVETNDRARELLCKGDGLVDRGGLLHAFSPVDDAELQRLVARALPSFGRQGVSGSMVVGQPLLFPRLALHISPTVEGQPNVRPRRIAALVLVVDPTTRVVVDPSLVAAALGLTKAESYVAVLLAEGKTIRDIAIATGRTENTIRWHVKRILDKHGISRQVELVQLVLPLATLPEDRS
ncbi:MAG: helix-turn-helix transcriptional regulator [Deltaproteobacteria bacterium]|nr:helix-turn-helix transcriptional regulator [Deltaproteobacteria bacterium]